MFSLAFSTRLGILCLASMILFLLADQVTTFAFPVQVPDPESQFTERWKAFDESIQVDVLGPAGFKRKVAMPFASLRGFRGQLAMPHDNMPIGQVFVLSSQQNRAVLLATPPDGLGGAALLSEEFRQTLQKCANDHSWIVALPENSWTEIELNPYCSMAYDEGGIVVELYWTKSSSRPLIDISTNGFSCALHQLFIWDPKAAMYRFKAQKCSGSRPPENYSFSSSMRQVVPPGMEPEGKSGQLRPWSQD